MAWAWLAESFHTATDQRAVQSTSFQRGLSPCWIHCCLSRQETRGPTCCTASFGSQWFSRFPQRDQSSLEDTEVILLAAKQNPAHTALPKFQLLSTSTKQLFPARFITAFSSCGRMKKERGKRMAAMLYRERPSAWQHIVGGSSPGDLWLTRKQRLKAFQVQSWKVGSVMAYLTGHECKGWHGDELCIWHPENLSSLLFPGVSPTVQVSRSDANFNITGNDT